MAMPVNRLVPSKANWRTGKQDAKENRNIHREAEKSECIESIFEPSIVGGENSFVEK